MLKVEFRQFGMLLDGKIVNAQRNFDLLNPSDGKAFASIADASSADFEKAIVAARKTFDQGAWPSLSVAERGIYLKKLSALIRKNAKELADLESAGCGKTLKQTTFIDIPTTADCFEYFSNIADELKDRKSTRLNSSH